ncbi:hypothetical protein [Sphingosinicella rhizophila]|uniref:Uncharacterized protein n=1 Tax=Sphingosinicella rhizophila TaxID=3050082 RepID=A0ABU3Q5G1_9SPHN|nr:hypothetical protein [Sphingosinicella sp. GR2756]MDT9598532.1 hypothetical protein [Sphingosinicella sp. GR2756]
MTDRDDGKPLHPSAYWQKRVFALELASNDPSLSRAHRKEVERVLRNCLVAARRAAAWEDRQR